MTTEVSERGVILAACVTTGAALSMSAAANYMLDPMAADLGLDASATTMIKYIPSLAAILMVFLAGVLGDRVGRRRVLAVGAATFSIGALITGIAPNVGFAIVGQSLMRASESLLTVVALAVLSATVIDPHRRASAFGTLGVVKPVVYLSVPILVGLLVTELGWRVVTAVWVVVGLFALWASLHFVPRDDKNRQAGELVTPLLAGVALVLIVQVLNSIGSEGLLAPATLLRIGGSIGVIVALMVIHRRLPRPTLGFAPLRSRQALLLLSVLALIPLGAMYYATYLVFQFAFGLTPFQISLIMIPAQVVGIVGAKLAGGILNGFGVVRAGVGAFAAFAVSQAMFLLVGLNDAVLTAALMAVFNFISIFIGVVLSKAIMDTAAPEESGTTSAYRSAAARIGDAIAPLALTVLVVGAYQTSLENQALEAGLDSVIVAESAEGFVDAQRAGEEIPPPPLGETVEVSDLHAQAMVDALHIKAIAGVVLCVVSGGLFYVAVRRRPSPTRVQGAAQSS